MPTMNEWQQQIAEERKAQEKWQTMTLEELEAEKLHYQGKLPFKLQMAWAKAKADRVNGVTHAPERSGADQHEVNIFFLDVKKRVQPSLHPLLFLLVKAPCNRAFTVPPWSFDRLIAHLLVLYRHRHSSSATETSCVPSLSS